MDKTKIEWADATWSPITGCSRISVGCEHCYAERLAGTRMKNQPSRQGLTRETLSGPVWTGEVRFNEKWLDQPLRWRPPKRIFVCAHSDLFHENVPDEWIDRIFAVMALAPHHTYLVLTKRAERMQRYMTGLDTEITDGNGKHKRDARLEGIEWRSCMVEGAAQKLHNERTGEDPSMWLAVHLPLPNVHIGVSIENQETAESRIPLLLKTPAAVRWVSAEPLIGPLDLRAILHGPNGITHDALLPWGNLWNASLDWVVVGGESGPGSRPMHPDWARSIRGQCVAARVSFFFKQWGDWIDDSEVPAPLRVRRLSVEGVARGLVA